MSLEVAELYGAALLEGSPLLGLRRFGVPPGGAFDQESLALGNALLGNPPGEPAVELSMASAVFAATADVRLSVVGAACRADMAGGRVEQTAFTLRVGERLSIGAPERGARVYLCVAGGWALGPPQEQITRGMRLLARTAASVDEGARRLARPPRSLDLGPLRAVVTVPEVFSRLEGRSLRVGWRSNRVGLRLEETGLDPLPEIVSEPCCPGTIQVANDGGLLILGPDGPTIGGYPKLGAVCSADLDRLGQVAPGTEVELRAISLEEAVEAARRRVESVAADVRQLAIGVRA